MRWGRGLVAGVAVAVVVAGPVRAAPNPPLFDFTDRTTISTTEDALTAAGTVSVAFVSRSTIDQQITLTPDDCTEQTEVTRLSFDPPSPLLLGALSHAVTTLKITGAAKIKDGETGCVRIIATSGDPAAPVQHRSVTVKER